MPTASIAEVELGIPQATRAVAVAFDADSIPVRRTEAKDGWLESDWFDAVTLRPTTRRRLGPDVVKVRVWIDPSRPNYSNITAETVYRPLADPSRADRELEQEVPANHPVSARVLIILGQLTRQYGGVAIDTTKTVKHDITTKPVRPDTATQPVKLNTTTKPVKPDTTTQPVKSDTTTKPVKPDTTTKPVKPDTATTQPLKKPVANP